MSMSGEGIGDFDSKGEFLASLIDFKRGSLTESQLAILEKIHGPISTDFSVFENDPLAPTPLDANHLQPYKSFAIGLMARRLDTRLMELGIELKDMQYGGILDALINKHSARIRQNTESLNRFLTGFLKDPNSVDDVIADAVHRARVSEATSGDKIRIIGNHRHIEAIDEADSTQPLDYDGIEEAKGRALSRVIAVRKEDESFKVARVLSEEEQKEGRRFVNLGELAKLGNMATKKTILEATYKGEPLALKQRESFFIFPATQDLGNTPRRIGVWRGTPMNVQSVGFSNYWSVPGTESEADLDAKDFEAEAAIFVPRGDSTVAMQIDAMRSGSSADS